MAENTAQYINLHIHEHTHILCIFIRHCKILAYIFKPSSSIVERDKGEESVQRISNGVLLSRYSMFVNGLTWYILSTPLLLAAFHSTIIHIASVNAVTDADIYNMNHVAATFIE
uniref:Uncharacterized protein n=1 Tax=Glossina austeni TaxID=7395 RepID=A0A1A9VCK0_GLOAU